MGQASMLSGMKTLDAPQLLSPALIEARGSSLVPDLAALSRVAGISRVQPARISGATGMLTLYKGKLTAHISSALDPQTSTDVLATLTVVAGSGRLQADDQGDEPSVWLLSEDEQVASEADEFWQAAMWLLMPPAVLAASLAATAQANGLPLYALESALNALAEARLIDHLGDFLPGEAAAPAPGEAALLDELAALTDQAPHAGSAAAAPEGASTPEAPADGGAQALPVEDAGAPQDAAQPASALDDSSGDAPTSGADETSQALAETPELAQADEVALAATDSSPEAPAPEAAEGAADDAQAESSGSRTKRRR